MNDSKLIFATINVQTTSTSNIMVQKYARMGTSSSVYASSDTLRQYWSTGGLICLGTYGTATVTYTAGYFVSTACSINYSSAEIYEFML